MSLQNFRNIIYIILSWNKTISYILRRIIRYKYKIFYVCKHNQSNLSMNYKFILNVISTIFKFL